MRFLRDSRAEVDEVTIAAGLGILVAEWLAELPDGMADHWLRAVAEKLEEMRAGVS